MHLDGRYLSYSDFVVSKQVDQDYKVSIHKTFQTTCIFKNMVLCSTINKLHCVGSASFVVHITSKDKHELYHKKYRRNKIWR